MTLQDAKVVAALRDLGENTIATALRQMLVNGLPVPAAIEILLNQICSIIALTRPAGTRAELLKSIIEELPRLVNQHVNAQFRTPAGLILPDAGVDNHAR